jgi:hypothetical protein
MGGAYCCSTVASVDRHRPKLEGGRKRQEKEGKGVAVKAGWDGMGWDLLAVSYYGDRRRSDGREAMNRGEKEWKNVEDSLTQICGRQTLRRGRSTPVRVWLQSMATEPGPGTEHIQRTYLKEDIDPKSN